jgi:hypothetical protein
VRKILSLTGATLGGAIGWWAGAYVGTMTAFIVSTIATGVGMYAGRKLFDDYLG